MLQDPWIQLAALPAIIAFASAGILRIAGGGTLGPRFACSGAGIALLAGLLLTWPAEDLISGRRVLVIAAAVAVGLLADLLVADLTALRRALVIVGPLLALIALRGSAFDAQGVVEMALFGGSFIALAVIAFSFSDFEPSNPTPAVLVGMAGLGIGLVLQFGGQPLEGSLALSAAAGVAGFFLWNWPVQRFANGAGLLIGVTTPLLALAATAAIEGTASRVALLLLVLIFFADKVFRLPTFSGRVGQALRPLILAAVCGLVVLAAVAVATTTVL